MEHGQTILLVITDLNKYITITPVLRYLAFLSLSLPHTGVLCGKHVDSWSRNLLTAPHQRQGRPI